MNDLIIGQRDGFPVFENGTSIPKIAEAIGPASMEEANDCLADLFMGLRSKSFHSDDDKKRNIRIYNRAVHGYPEFAIREAVDRFIAHEVKRRPEEMDFVPTAGALAAEIRTRMLMSVRWKDPVSEINSYIPAPKSKGELITPEQMDELRTHFGLALSGEAKRKKHNPRKGN